MIQSKTEKCSNTKCKCFPNQSPTLTLSPQRKWIIYTIGILETFIFGGCFLGWAQLVYVLKNEQIFSDLCLQDFQDNNDTYSASQDNFTYQEIYIGCEEQDQKFALIYTITCMIYATPAILIGMILHHFGLAVSRISATFMIMIGFMGLGMTTKENDKWLNLAMISIGFGGNQLRLSGLQFCNLFPKYRATALTVISGTFAASAGIFMIFQVGQNNGLSLWIMSFSLALVAFLSMIATVIMPWHHIPYVETNKLSKQYEWRREDIHLLKSLFSISSLTHILWIMMIFVGIFYFNIAFNSWITKISETNEEAGKYSMIYSVSSFACPLIAPFPGLLTDYMSRCPKGSSLETQIHMKLKSPAIALSIVTVISMMLQACLLFNHYIAIYVSLIILVVLRPSSIAVGTAFLRIRFPPYHFDRLIGTYGTLISLLSSIQYPIFIWAQSNFVLATVVFICMIGVSIVQPLHLFSKSYRIKIIKQSIRKEDEKELECL